MSALQASKADYERRIVDGRGAGDPALAPLDYSVFPRPGNRRRFWDITMAIARNDLKQRYFSSVAGYVWTLIRPLAIFGTLYVVFTHIVRIGSAGVENYPLYLLMALVMWGYFSETTTAAVTSFVTRADMVRKINFPLVAIPLAGLLTTGVHLAMNLVIVLVFFLASGIYPTLSWLGAIPLLAVWVVFANAVGMVLSVLYIRLRDTLQVWDVGVQVLFWATPIIYVATFPDEPLESILAVNPLSSMITEMRHLVLDPAAPSAADVLGGGVLALVPLAIVALTVAGALLLFARAARGAIERL